jgi:hypothetical protein
VFGTIFKEVVQSFIAQNIVVVVGTDFDASVQQERGTNIEEQTYTFVQEILAQISKSLAQILCEYLAQFSR